MKEKSSELEIFQKLMPQKYKTNGLSFFTTLECYWNVSSSFINKKMFSCIYAFNLFVNYSYSKTFTKSVYHFI